MTTTNDTGADTRHDAPIVTQTIDDVVFQLDAAGGLAFIDMHAGDEARLVALDTRQHRALATFYAGIMRDALRVRDKRIADICLAMVDTPAE